LIAASADKAVAPSVATKIASLAPHARVLTIPGAGHLAHEEKPVEVANIIANAPGQSTQT
jgi:magnesium chelatase accessory protein